MSSSHLALGLSGAQYLLTLHLPHQDSKFLGSRGSYLKSPLEQLDLDGDRAAASVGTQQKREKERESCGGSIPGFAGKPGHNLDVTIPW